MSEDIYERLREHLNEFPGGFPETESGVEIKILKKLFTSEEAEMAMCLILGPEPVSATRKVAPKRAIVAVRFLRFVIPNTPVLA